MRKLIIIGILFATVLGYAVSKNYTNAQTADVSSNSPILTVATSTTTKIKIPILVYHSVRPYYPGITDLVKEYTVPPDIFEEQLKYMRDNGFTAITPDDVVNYFTIGKALPPKPFMITLDDGWGNQFRYAFPILEKYNDPAVFYIYKNAIGGKVFLSWDQVKKMLAANMIIGDHTESHPELPKIKDTALLDREIIDSKKYIETKIGKILDTFAYPFGEYNQQDVNVVQQAGYTSARTIEGCVYQSPDKLLTLCGAIITGDFNRFVSIVNR